MPPNGPHIDPVIISDLGIRHAVDVPLGPMTWYNIGGSADVFAQPDNPEQLAVLVNRCYETGTGVYVLGSGANLLVADAGVRGVVVKLDAEAFVGVRPINHCITAGAGADLAKLVLESGRLGLAGLEVLAGIPASVGGAVRMNCGGKYGDIAATVHSATVMSNAGDLHTLKRDRIEFDYRYCSLRDGIICSVTFELNEEDPVAVRERIKDIFAYKKKTQPLAAQSAGCAFKNPIKATDKAAGRLIDEAGLKGFAVGGAQVSPVHANFITLAQGGSADDVVRLIRAVKRRVAEETGVRLEEEVVIWGDMPVEP